MYRNSNDETRREVPKVCVHSSNRLLEMGIRREPIFGRSFPCSQSTIPCLFVWFHPPFFCDAWLGRIFTNEILQSLTSGSPLYTVFDREDAAPVCQENISDGSNFQDYWLQSLWHVHWIASNGDAAAIC